MSLRLLHLLFLLAATWLLPGLPASANRNFGTPASFVIEDKPNDVAIDVYYVVHRPRSFPDALFLVEFRRKDFGEWKRSIGKAKYEIQGDGMKTLAVTWTNGPLEGDTSVLEIQSPTTAKWKDGESEKEDVLSKPLFGQQFDLKADRLPGTISSRLASMRTSSLHHVILELGKF